MRWEVLLHADVEAWFLDLVRSDSRSADLIEAALDLLAAKGPALGRPLADRIKGSTVHHLKELRPASAGASEVRMLFAFDPEQQAFVLVAGDKARNWRGWYEQAIPLAEKRYAQHLAELIDRRGENR